VLCIFPVISQLDIILRVSTTCTERYGTAVRLSGKTAINAKPASDNIIYGWSICLTCPSVSSTAQKVVDCMIWMKISGRIDVRIGKMLYNIILLDDMLIS